MIKRPTLLNIGDRKDMTMQKFLKKKIKHLISVLSLYPRISRQAQKMLEKGKSVIESTYTHNEEELAEIIEVLQREHDKIFKTIGTENPNSNISISHPVQNQIQTIQNPTQKNITHLKQLHKLKHPHSVDKYLKLKGTSPVTIGHQHCTSSSDKAKQKIKGKLNSSIDIPPSSYTQTHTNKHSHISSNSNILNNKSQHIDNHSMLPNINSINPIHKSPSQIDSSSTRPPHLQRTYIMISNWDCRNGENRRTQKVKKTVSSRVQSTSQMASPTPKFSNSNQHNLRVEPDHHKSSYADCFKSTDHHVNTNRQKKNHKYTKKFLKRQFNKSVNIVLSQQRSKEHARKVNKSVLLKDTQRSEHENEIDESRSGNGYIPQSLLDESPSLHFKMRNELQDNSSIFNLQFLSESPPSPIRKKTEEKSVGLLEERRKTPSEEGKEEKKIWKGIEMLGKEKERRAQFKEGRRSESIHAQPSFTITNSNTSTQDGNAHSPQRQGANPDSDTTSSKMSDSPQKEYSHSHSHNARKPSSKLSIPESHPHIHNIQRGNSVEMPLELRVDPMLPVHEKHNYHSLSSVHVPSEHTNLNNVNFNQPRQTMGSEETLNNGYFDAHTLSKENESFNRKESEDKNVGDYGLGSGDNSDLNLKRKGKGSGPYLIRKFKNNLSKLGEKGGKKGKKSNRKISIRLPPVLNKSQEHNNFYEKLVHSPCNSGWTIYGKFGGEEEGNDLTDFMDYTNKKTTSPNKPYHFLQNQRHKIYPNNQKIILKHTIQQSPPKNHS
jgi:hypothetical protein